MSAPADPGAWHTPQRRLQPAVRGPLPVTGPARRVLLTVLLLGAGAVAVALTLRGDDPVVRVTSWALGAVIVVFVVVVLRRPATGGVLLRVALAALVALWLAVLAAQLARPESTGGGWDSLFPSVFMGLALLVVVGYLVYPARYAVLHSAALVAGTVLVALLGLLAAGGGPADPDRGEHVVDLLRYAVYLGALAAMVHVLSRATEQAARAFQAASDASAEAASLREMAHRDPLTGVANRRRLVEELTFQARLAAAGRDVALLYLDLDRFKQVNDEHGHAVGDRVLTAVAAELVARVRPGDLVARLGGEEFVVVAPGLSPADAGQVAERLRRALPSALRDRAGVPVTASFGVTRLRPGEDPARAIDRVDAVMYVAKRAGRDRVEVADHD